MELKYSAAGLFDEMFQSHDTCRDHYKSYQKWLSDIPTDQIKQKQQEADLLFHRLGITFNVYGRVCKG